MLFNFKSVEEYHTLAMNGVRVLTHLHCLKFASFITRLPGAAGIHDALSNMKWTKTRYSLVTRSSVVPP
jgi:hypothetical protein